MSSSRNIRTDGGIGFAGLLTVLFIGLKLTGYIDWSWWWVLSPLWISFLVVAVFLAVVFTIAAWGESRKGRRKYR